MSNLSVSDSRWRIAILPYFSQVGEHETSLIEEDSNGKLNNISPYITKLALFDNIQLVDLAYGHLQSLNFLETRTDAHVCNLGAVQGLSGINQL